MNDFLGFSNLKFMISRVNDLISSSFNPSFLASLHFIPNLRQEKKNKWIWIFSTFQFCCCITTISFFSPPRTLLLTRLCPWQIHSYSIHVWSQIKHLFYLLGFCSIRFCCVVKCRKHKFCRCRWTRSLVAYVILCLLWARRRASQSFLLAPLAPPIEHENITQHIREGPINVRLFLIRILTVHIITFLINSLSMWGLWDAVDGA